MVSEGKQIYKCFGCGEGGDIFNFIQKYCKTTFPESVTYVAAKYGIAENDTNFQTPVFKGRNQRKNQLNILTRLCCLGPYRQTNTTTHLLSLYAKDFQTEKKG